MSSGLAGKAFGSQLLVPPIARRKKAAADDDFPNFAVGHGFSLLVEQLNFDVRNRPSDRQPARGSAFVQRKAPLRDVAGFRRGK